MGYYASASGIKGADQPKEKSDRLCGQYFRNSSYHYVAMSVCPMISQGIFFRSFSHRNLSSLLKTWIARNMGLSIKLIRSNTMSGESAEVGELELGTRTLYSEDIATFKTHSDWITFPYQGQFNKLFFQRTAEMRQCWASRRALKVTILSTTCPRLHTHSS